MMKPAWAMFADKMMSQGDVMLLFTFRVLKRLSEYCLINNTFCYKVNMIYEVKIKENLIKQVNIKKTVTRLKQVATNITISTAHTDISSNTVTTMSPSKKLISVCCRLGAL